MKLDPATQLEIPLSPPLLFTEGQITRLTYGNGWLWAFANPIFHKVDPVSGAVLESYCLDDGGDNVLLLNDHFWSVNRTVLKSYVIP